MCQLLDLPEPGLKEAQIPTEFVDDKARKALPLFRAEQGNRTVKLGKNSSAVDIPRE